MYKTSGTIGPDRTGSRNPDDGSQSLTRLIAPLFAAFTLPTIVLFITTVTPAQPWYDIVLSLLIAATGLFMASIQLSIGTLYNTYPSAGKFRAALTLLGLILVAASLFFMVWPLIDSKWLWIPLGALMLGGLVPVIWIIRLESPYWRFIRRLFRTSLRSLPSGWRLEGQSGDYETGIVRTSESGENRVARLRARTVGEPVDSAALVQSIAATRYRGQRVRFGGLVRARRVTDRGGLWLRVGGPGGTVILDEVQRTPLHGTTDWICAEIVVDVPDDAQELRFGVLLRGSGAVDMASLCLETVGQDVQVTARSALERLPGEPRALDFREAPRLASRGSGNGA